MSELKQLQGNHTWALVLDYSCCPKCEYIFENQEPFQDRFGKLQKHPDCPRCHFTFTIPKLRSN